jgi:glycogen synthase
VKQIPILIISPEVYGLPAEMDPMAKYVTREGGGGLGDVIRGIIVELHAREIEGFYIGPNYKKIFKNNSKLSKDEYIKKVHCSRKNQVVLLSSSHFSYLNRIYDGNTTLSAALMQDLALPSIKNINSDHGKRSIIHTHDQSAGIIPAYCKSRGIPTIHTVHNAFTYNIPHEYFPHADLTGGEMGLKNYLYNTSWESNVLDSHATAVKNADIVTFVGQSFLEEILAGRFDNWNLFAGAKNTFNEIKIKSHFNQNKVIMNGISPVELPENQDFLPRSFGPDTIDIVAAKKINLVEFQKKMGLTINENAILLYWPSRIDENQKGVESLLKCTLQLLNKNENVQIAIVGDDSTPDKKYIPIVNSLSSRAPKGQFAHRPFEKKLSTLGYAASSVIIGASHYEPFGLFWLQGVCAGAFGVGAKNGGAIDILREFDVAKKQGNGFFYKTPNADDLKNGLQNAIMAITKLQKNPQLYNAHLRRMMTDARRDFSITKMVESYIDVYEQLGHAYNLFTDGYSHFNKTKPMPLKLTGS